MVRENMLKQIDEMPPTERVAIGLLKLEGFQKIRWVSLINWYSSYDFTAERDGVEYCVEVQRFTSPIKAGKLKRLKLLGKPVLFLLLTKEKYALIRLEEIENVLGQVISSFHNVFPLDGRITLPWAIRKKANVINRKAFCQVENSGKDKILITVLHRYGLNSRANLRIGDEGVSQHFP
jgi:hypothetical protein